MLTKIERVSQVLRGEKPDRPPYSFWHHFPPEEATGARAVEAHLKHLRRYDLDFLKVMNDCGYPWQQDGVINSAADLLKIKEYKGTDGPFAEQLEVLSKLARELRGENLMTSTIFNPWAVLRSLTVPPKRKHGPPDPAATDSLQDKNVSRLLREDRAAVRAALLIIARSLAAFAAENLKAGADGIFLSVRDDWVDSPENGAGTYSELVEPADRMIADSASPGTFNMLHVCCRSLDFKRFIAYPFQVINWADRYAGPPIREAVKLKPHAALCGGVDNLVTLVKRAPGDVRREVLNALEQAAGRPIMIAPGCTYDPEAVPAANLDAIAGTAKAYRG